MTGSQLSRGHCRRAPARPLKQSCSSPLSLTIGSARWGRSTTVSQSKTATGVSRVRPYSVTDLPHPGRIWVSAPARGSTS